MIGVSHIGNIWIAISTDDRGNCDTACDKCDCCKWIENVCRHNMKDAVWFNIERVGLMQVRDKCEWDFDLGFAFWVCFLRMFLRLFLNLLSCLLSCFRFQIGPQWNDIGIFVQLQDENLINLRYRIQIKPASISVNQKWCSIIHKKQSTMQEKLIEWVQEYKQLWQLVQTKKTTLEAKKDQTLDGNFKTKTHGIQRWSQSKKAQTQSWTQTRIWSRIRTKSLENAQICIKMISVFNKYWYQQALISISLQ